MRIFLVDDEILALRYMAHVVHEAVPGAVIESFGSPAKLLAFAQTALPDVVFSDIEMPGMTGIELARRLQELNPRVNIVFTTGYSEYALDAVQIFASGYVLKPVKVEDIKKQLSNLRYPVKEEPSGPVAKTFGNFDFLVNGEPVRFSRKPSKEILAYLIDRGGVSVTKRALADILWDGAPYDDNARNYLAHLIYSLRKDLEKAGAGELLVLRPGDCYIRKDRLKCDLYEYLDGNTSLYHGEYMEQYSWGENFKANHNQ